MVALSQLLGKSLAVLALGIASSATASVLQSRVTEGVEVAYSEPGICETTPGVKSYSGYITLPSTALQPYSQKLFFWFFESRHDPSNAPLSLWLQGGPGSPSIDQALGENGPCIAQADANSTVLNPWSWNNYANLLYIDQPVQTGFSYDVATPGVIDAITGDIYPNDTWADPLNYTAVSGTFSSQDSTKVVNTTAVAAEAIWEFLQVWMGEFEQYHREKISIWTQSYGGHYAPAIANLLQTRAESCSGDTLSISVDTVGIVSGFIDFLIQGESYPNFAINNTYGIQAYDVEVAESAAANWSMPGGCKEQVEACRALTPNGYRDQYGTNDTVTEACGNAFAFCWGYVYYAYDALSGRDPFDIGHLTPVSFPPPYAYGFLSQDWVLKALGAEVNYTQNNNPTANGFTATGDFAFGGFREDLASLLDSGVRVALINGDRDFRCNWVAGEAVSLAVEYEDQADFAAAGYAQIETNSSYVGGMVRQYGSFSFSRVFEAGHMIGWYQPETAYQIFTRTLLGQDVATGGVSLDETPDYATEGPASVFNITNEVPTPPPSECFILAYPLYALCTDEQLGALLEGTAVVENNVVARSYFAMDWATRVTWNRPGLLALNT
ncbi:serine carboxypeptidase [Seiridium cupressi]